MNEIVVKSQYISDKFDFRYINLAPPQELENIGKFNFRKLLWTFVLFGKIFMNTARFRPQLAYHTLAPRGLAFYRDAIVVHILRAFGIRRVLHLHGRGISSHLASNKARQWLCQSVFKDADVIVLSPRLKTDVEKIVPEARIHVVANGIPDPFNGTPPLRRVQARAPRVLFLSNLLESKGPLLLLQALAELRRGGLNFVADFVGVICLSMTEEDLFAMISKLGLNGIVRIRGPLYGDAKTVALREADIFAFPTFYANETQGLVLLEAMAARLPIVTTTVGGIPDYVEAEKTGLLIAPKEQQALTDALRRLIENRALRLRLGRAARLRYEHHYTEAHFLASLRSVLLRCANHSSVSGSA